MPLTHHLDLRGGRVCWADADNALPPADPAPRSVVDVAIVGAGVMGAMLAERLSATGRSVALFDRRPPVQGSTAASTALVMWGADTPLTALILTHGPEEAARRWRKVHAAALNLAQRVTSLELDCGWIARPELYLAGDLLDESGLRAETDARRAAGLPSQILDAATVGDRFGLPPRAGILSGDAYEVDPVALSLGLLARARRHGASLSYPAEVVDVAPAPQGARLTLADGADVLARQAVLATGYETAHGALPPAFRLGSSFAVATSPGVAPLWRENALIWEASDPYLYARATTDGRVVVGGCDEDFSDPVRRDGLIDAKRQALERGSRVLLGRDEVVADCAWAATFGRSPDGLPAIGRVRGFEALWLACGFGGNGVTFASLAASLIAEDLAGDAPDLECFSPYRFG